MYDDIEIGDQLPGGFVVISLTSSTVTIQGPIVAGVPVSIVFDRDQFEAGFNGLLDLLGIPHA